MPILNNPPELLQLFLLHCPTSDFLQLAQTCRVFHTLAFTTREVVLHHLRRIPGLLPGSHSDGGDGDGSGSGNGGQGIEDRSTEDLAMLLRRRAARHLYGATFHSDATNFIPFRGIIDTSASTVRVGKEGPGLGTGPGWPNVAIVDKKGSCVCLYHLDERPVKDESEKKREKENGREFRLMQTLEVPYERPGRVEVLKILLCSKTLISVLVKYEPIEPVDGSQDNRLAVRNSFEREAMKPFRTAGVHLIHFERAPGWDNFDMITFAAFGDQEGFEPVAIDVFSKHLVAVAWKHETDPQRRVVKSHVAYDDPSVPQGYKSYMTYEDVTLADEAGARTLHQTSRPLDPVVKLRFNDHGSQLLYYHPSNAIYNKFQIVQSPSGTSPVSNTIVNPIHANFANVRFPDTIRLVSFKIDIPFYSTHRTYTEPVNNTQFCHWQYLSLGTATHPASRRRVACLLRSEAQPHAINCQHIENLDRGRRLDAWTIVARLWGYRSSDNTLAGLTASSPRSTRIAVANWKTVLVWSLAPEEIISGNAKGYYPENMLFKPDIVDLKPIVLNIDAVCHELRFVGPGEDELLALTDKGLVRWDLGPRGRGFRCKKFLSGEIEKGESSGSRPSRCG